MRSFLPSALKRIKSRRKVSLSRITLSATKAVLPRGPVRVTSHGFNVTTGENGSTRRKPALLYRVKQDNAFLTYDQGNFNQTTARSRNRTRVTVVKDACTTTVPPAPHQVFAEQEKSQKCNQIRKQKCL